MTQPATALLNNVDIGAVSDLVGSIRERPEVADTAWRARVQWLGGFRSEALIRDFPPIASDEPKGLGGADSAPNPVEQLLGALGNCLAVGYAANATAAGIEIRDLSIELEGDIDLRTFLGLEEGHAGYESIRVRVWLDTDATAEQLAELHDKVTGTSPVGHTIHRAVALHIEPPLRGE